MDPIARILAEKRLQLQSPLLGKEGLGVVEVVEKKINQEVNQNKELNVIESLKQLRADLDRLIETLSEPQSGLSASPAHIAGFFNEDGFFVSRDGASCSIPPAFIRKRRLSSGEPMSLTITKNGVKIFS